MSRATFLVMSDFERLEEWCQKVRRIFRLTPFLVGSALTTPDYRDVDIRLILNDTTFDDIAGGDPVRVRFINRALSVWGQQETGLAIDFQVQRRTEANAKFDGPRSPMGVRDWATLPTSGAPAARLKEADHD